MAKVSKAVKQKRKDFAKTKLKVGKHKGQADNYTDTSFKAAKIVLPKQSVNNAVHIGGAQQEVEEGAGDAGKFLEDAAKNRAVLSKLLGLLQHKAHDTRKDALVSLTGFLTTKHKHHQVSSVLLTPIMAKLVPMILDEDRQVRRQLLATFEMLQELGRRTQPTSGRSSADVHAHSDGGEENVLARYADDLLLYISSAMTHIVASIRADSTKFLALLVSSSTESTDIFADDRPGPVSPVLRRLIVSADAAQDARTHGGAGLAKLIDCFALLLGIGGSDAQGPSAATTRVATTTGIKTTVQHLRVLAVILDAALKPEDTALRIAPTIRCGMDGSLTRVGKGKDVQMQGGIFVVASRILSIYETSTLNLFAPGSALERVTTGDVQADDDDGEHSAARLIVLRHATGLVKFLTDLFADGVNMHLELCVPCLRVFIALAPLLVTAEGGKNAQMVATLSKKQQEISRLMSMTQVKLRVGVEQLVNRGGTGVALVSKAYGDLCTALQVSAIDDES
jgi:hypothetical protein